MKLYDILEDFKGSQDGTRAENFEAGTQRELSDHLAPHVVPQGWARLAEPQADLVGISAAQPLDNKAIATDGTRKPGAKALKRAAG